MLSGEARAAWITGRAEPVILRRTGRTRPHAGISGAIHGRAEDLLQEHRIGADNGGRQVL